MALLNPVSNVCGFRDTSTPLSCNDIIKLIGVRSTKTYRYFAVVLVLEGYLPQMYSMLDFLTYIYLNIWVDFYFLSWSKSLVGSAQANPANS